MKKLILLFAAAIILIACKQEPVKTDYLGIVNITISGKDAAIPHFEKGLLLLHSFEYRDACESFKLAQAADSNMAMAYWGEAMTYNHALWQDQDYDAALMALSHLEHRDYKEHSTELEQDFIQAVQILYQAEKTKYERDVAYADFLSQMLKKYPNNHEVQAFYAISLLGSVKEGRDMEVYQHGARIANGVLKENPNHPGALHYLIHANDDPVHAEFALDAAYAYSKVAPDASHALHMPSHIFLALGMWDEVISSNIASYQASVNRMERKELDNNARGYHAYHWLQYGYLQKDNFEEAKKMALQIAKYADETPSKRGRGHVLLLKGSYLVDSEEWDGEVANIQIDVDDMNISARSSNLYLEGMKAYHQGNISAMDSIIFQMQNELKTESIVVNNSEFKVCAGVSRADSDNLDLLKAEIRMSQLKALRGVLDSQPELAETEFQYAIQLADSAGYNFGPPRIAKPPHELYADWLMGQDRYQEASSHYKSTLDNAPKRNYALKRLEEAEKLQL